MDAPSIQYARTDDGVNIAYWTLGAGPPLIIAELAFIDIDQAWRIDDLRTFYEGLAQHSQLVQVISRGIRPSDVGAPDMSIAARVCDLTAVIDALALDRVHLLAGNHNGPLGMQFAASFPDRLRHLILWTTYARYDEYIQIPGVATVRALSESDPEVWANTGLLHVCGWSGFAALAPVFDTIRRQFLEFRGDAPALYDANADIDGYALAEQIAAPTLVMHRREAFPPSSAAHRGIAATIPNGRLRVLEGDSSMLGLGDSADLIAAIDSFLAEDELSPSDSDSPFRAILFTDVVNSTPILTQLKDEKMRVIMRDHDAVLQQAIAEHQGRVVKTLGDGFMAEFALPSGAVEAAVAIQRGIRERFAGSDVPVRLRIGINAGEPILEDDDLHGASVVIAKRLESAAAVDGILISEGVKQLLAGQDFRFRDQGALDLKGFDEPIRAWAVDWDQRS